MGLNTEILKICRGNQAMMKRALAFLCLLSVALCDPLPQHPEMRTSGGEECGDENLSGYCLAKYQYMCTHPQFSDWFVPDCQRLCGECESDSTTTTGGEECEDKNLNGMCFEKYQFMCTQYQEVYDWFPYDCQKLCGKCGSDLEPPPCVDFPGMDCQAITPGVCNGGHVFHRQLCRKSCNWC